MKTLNEHSVFNEILSSSPSVLRATFSANDEGTFFRFFKKNNPSHYVTVDKEKSEHFWVPVNADFDFQRPAGSNNYAELIDVGKKLVNAFGLKINW